MDEVKPRVIDLDLNDVLPNRFQPRIKFSEDSIIELSESIKEHGVIQPIVVRPIGDKYEIIAGERRYKASVLAGKETIPAIITDLNDKDSAEVALIENVQRRDLSAIEEAISYKKILDMGYLTQEQLAVKLGKSQSTVANKIRLLNLCDEVQEALMEDKISERHARSMLKLPTADMQRKMLEKIIKERLTVRKTDEEIDKMNTYITNPIDIPEEQQNPGFVDVDKIANNAQDLKFEDPSGNVNINALLQGNSASKPAVEATIPVIPAVESNVTPIPMVDPVAPIIPEIPVPTVEPVAPVIPEIPVPTVDPVAPVIPEIPVPTVDPVAPAIPEIPVPTVEPVAPVVPEMPVPTVEPVAPVVPEMPVPTVEPVAPVVPEIPVPTVEPVAPVIPEMPVPMVAPVAPVTDVTEENPSESASGGMVSTVPVVPESNSTSIFESAPAITPIVEPVVPIAPMPTTPIVEESLPSKFLDTPEVPQVPETPEIPEVPEVNELEEAEARLEEKADEIKPIIITDYTKQYDPVIPNAAPTPEKVDFKQIINLIRDVNTTIEKCGYSIETEEYDLEGVYQVVFKINKN